ncbi:hypothetical protein SLEP1_g22771 [Rubroshorea leprosula]|uniref:Retrotransposon gag domain-containing protein n=1 Tax=Rubroshorea leprosula TaxID=152421 RepID=A0AAV5JGA2_9ROSI|nr:hypothetical protein SLEP1_g22771 [Rubroshorea leprosula]
MFEENTATNPKKSTVDERVDKLEATMQTMAMTLQAISLTLSNLTTSFVSSSIALVSTTPTPSVPIPSSTIAPGSRAKAPMMYARKMAPNAKGKRVLIHYFQDSLSGPASIWFSILDKKKIRTFKDVSQTFMKQYEYNISLAPTRDSLQRITKKGNETFKEFAQWWRSEAAKVIPPLTDSEICSLFIKSTTGIFRACLHPTEKEDEEAFSHISTCHAKPIYNVAKIPYNQQPQLQYTSAFKLTTYPQRRPNFNTQAPTRQQFPSTNRPWQFTKLPIPYSEVLEQLVAVVGHSTEHCTTLKHKIQDLIDEGKLQLDAKEAESTPNITRNPLPPHDAGTMNMVALDEVEKLVLENANFLSLDELFAILTKYNLIQPIAQMSLNVSPVIIDDALVCPYHSNMKGHTLKDCEDFQKKFKEMAEDDITNEVCSDDEEDYFGFNNLFEPTNMIDPKERWRRMLVERASMEKHPNFHLVHHAKAPMGSHESMLLGIREEESLCDSWRNLTINGLDKEQLKFDRGVSLVNGSFQANWTAELLPATFIFE